MGILPDLHSSPASSGCIPSRCISPVAESSTVLASGNLARTLSGVLFFFLSISIAYLVSPGVFVQAGVISTGGGASSVGHRDIHDPSIPPCVVVVVLLSAWFFVLMSVAVCFLSLASSHVISYFLARFATGMICMRVFFSTIPPVRHLLYGGASGAWVLTAVVIS